MKAYYLKRIQVIYPAYFVLLLLVYSLRLSFPKTLQQALAVLPIEVLGLQSLFPKLFNLLANGGTWFFLLLLFYILCIHFYNIL